MTESKPEAHATDSNQGEKQWWYNLKKLRAEFGLQSAALYRVGPFATKAEAEMAPILLRERSRLWASEEADEN